MGAQVLKKLAGAAMAAVFLSAVSAAALDVSAGISGSFNSNFGGGVKAEYNTPGYSYKGELNMPWIGGGIGAFFDVMGYAEFSVAYVYGSGDYKDSDTESSGGNTYSDSYKFGVSYSFADISLLFKYPIDLGSMVIFPAAGITYQFCGSLKDEDGNSFPGDADDLSRLWIKFGAGIDFPLNEKMFIRGMALYGIGLANKYEDDVNKYYYGDEGDVLMSHGLTIKAGVGFKF